MLDHAEGEEGAARRRRLHGRSAGQDRHRDRQGHRLHPEVADRAGRGQDRVVRPARPDVSYVPRGARSYELPSKSGKESVGVIAFLMSQPQTPEVKAAAQAAIAWFKSDAVKVANTAYVSRPSSNTDDNYNPIQAQVGQHDVVPVLRPGPGRRLLQRPTPDRQSARHRQAIRHHGHRARAPLRLPVGRQLRHGAVHVHAIASATNRPPPTKTGEALRGRRRREACAPRGVPARARRCRTG